jgi:predicted HTH transcriptional regulator
MSASEIEDLIKYPKEERYLEFKGPISWDNPCVQANLTKSIMAIANLRDGGWIIIGKEEQNDRTFKMVGISQEQLASFDPDEMKAFVNSHVEPPVAFEIFNRDLENMTFLVVKIVGFTDLPIICKKGAGDPKQGVTINAGKIYCRSKGKPESVPVPSVSEMQEIIDIAVDKGISGFVERLNRTGIWAPNIQKENVTDEERFNKQIGDLR